MNQEHYDILVQGVSVWNEWRKDNPNITPNLVNVNLARKNLQGINLSKADLTRSYLVQTDLSKAILSEANLLDANLANAILSKAILSGTKLIRATLNNAIITSANLFGAILVKANLKRATLTRTKLIEAQLIEVDLNGAKLLRSNLTRTNLAGSNLTGANLTEANLTSTNLMKANLSRANISGAIFSKAILSNTILELAILNYTVFCFIDFSTCIKLEMIKHNGPSSMDKNSIVKSGGKIPDAFFQGIGFSKWEILAARLHNPNLLPDQITDLVYEIDHARNSSPIQLFNIFISYSHTDSKIAERLENTMKAKDIRCWRDVHDMVSGPIEKQIDKAIRMNETVLLILSKNSVNSDWVEWEIQKARQLEKELDRHVICPVALDDSWKTCNWSGVLRNQIQKYNILDFSNWKDEAFFNRQFAKLLKGLNVYYRNEA